MTTGPVLRELERCTTTGPRQVALFQLSSSPTVYIGWADTFLFYILCIRW
jgi:hypothetical protein